MQFMRKLAVMAGVSILFLLVLSVSAMAQTSALEGEVIGKDGQPLKGAMIYIERTDIKGKYKTKTNKKGRYFHAGLPLGTYNIMCEVDGAKADQMNGVRLKLGETTPINFDLEAMAKKQEAMQRAAASGQLTEEATKGMTAEQKAALKKQMEARQKQMAKNKELNDAFNVAMTAKEAKDWDVALENFEAAAELDPDQTAVWANLADTAVQGARSKTGEAQKAMLQKGLDAYVHVIGMQPENPAFHNNYGLALAQGGDLEAAGVELGKAAELNPDNAGQYYYNLGAVLINTGNTAGASDAFKKATEIDPDYANAYYQYGMQLLSQATLADDGSMSAPEGTQAALEKYLELDPNGAFAPSAQGALQAMGMTIETSYDDPNRNKKTKKKK
jgi:tetratricopeptide (TPR) repeat protein